MSETGFRRSPLLQKGAFVQLIREVVTVVPNIVVFQYNPERLQRSLTPWNPFEVDPSNRGSLAPQVQPYTPRETFTLSIELDASDGLEEGAPQALTAGIADRLAALKKLTAPSRGLFGDLAASAAALGRRSARQAQRPTVPVTLFVWGPGRVLPVRITSFSVEETQFSPLLYPTMARVNLQLEVLSPELFRCQNDLVSKIAVAAYQATQMQEDALAVANIASNIDTLRALLPF